LCCRLLACRAKRIANLGFTNEIGDVAAGYRIICSPVPSTPLGIGALLEVKAFKPDSSMLLPLCVGDANLF
jgi:hypothetical protein